MHYQRVDVLKPTSVLLLGTGNAYVLDPGEQLLAPEVLNNREYHIIQDSRIGAITAYWETQQKLGNIILHANRQSVEAPLWHGVALPITSSKQLNKQLLAQPIAYFIRGELWCYKCAEGNTTYYPDSLPVTPANIMPKSQDCHKCGQLLIIVERDKRGPAILFKKYVTFKQYKAQGYK